ncbi:MAG TPA: hypothetical protein VFE19_12775 [Jatrophihabitantaceae bacterium]|nr:hypothetical protein [Jatrophihabitantaceae bacterium]
MDWIAGLVVAVVVVGLLLGLQARRRRQARQLAEEAGATPVSVPAPSGFVSGVGAPNPALPPPAVVPDQSTGIAPSGATVRLTVCGLPALAWQRSEFGPNTYQGMRLAMIVDAGVGLPALQLFHHAGLLQRFAGAHGPSGIGALDEKYRMAGDLAAWLPILSTPVVQQALIRYPLETFSVLGGRLTFVSGDGVHLDAEATSAISWLAATIIAAIPPQVTSAAPMPPPTAMVGTDVTDVDSIVSNVLAKSNLSPEQQQAMLALIRANQQH